MNNTAISGSGITGAGTVSRVLIRIICSTNCIRYYIIWLEVQIRHYNIWYQNNYQGVEKMTQLLLVSSPLSESLCLVRRIYTVAPNCL